MAVDLYHVTAIPQLDGYDITGAGQIDGPLVRRITPSFVVRAPASLHLDCSRLPSLRDDARNQPRGRRGDAGDTIGGLRFSPEMLLYLSELDRGCRQEPIRDKPRAV